MVNPLYLLVPGTRIELVQSYAPRDFKSLASTYSATQAKTIFSYTMTVFFASPNLAQTPWILRR